jgi:IS30 family transposase
VVGGQSIRSIAATLERAPSTISREIKRNGDRETYRASQADQAAWAYRKVELGEVRLPTQAV